MGLVLLLVAMTAVGSFALTGAVRSYALRRELLDHPNARSSHSVPTPRGGGAGVLVSTALALAVGAWLGAIQMREALILGSGMLSLGLLGWVDDTRNLKAGVRLTIHVIVAAWTAYMLGGLPLIRFGNASLVVGAFGYLIAVFAIVWSINLFNFMDGIDGLAASQAVLIFATFATLLCTRGDSSLAVIAAVVASSSAGFLVWNWPPARIFLGDVGSGPIGYMIASVALGAENHQSVPLVASVIIYGVFICDASVTLIRRLLRGSRLTEAHRDHAYQRLTRAWGSHRPVTLWTAAVTILLAVVAAVSTLKESFLLPGLIGAALFLAVLLLAVERRAPM
jgi:Fuc2NAc and GlcNAc transferase